jgi:hypothetical protein
MEPKPQKATFEQQSFDSLMQAYNNNQTLGGALDMTQLFLMSSNL